MLFPCHTGLSSYRNPQDLLALYALLLETTELHLSSLYRSAIYEENPFRAKNNGESLLILQRNPGLCPAAGPLAQLVRAADS